MSVFGEKKTAANGWRVSGVDSMGRPIYIKDETSKKSKKESREAVRRAMNPMEDYGGGVDKKKLDKLPEQFNKVFYDNGWDDISDDGHTLYGTAEFNGEDVIVGMARRGGETIVSAGDTVVASLTQDEVKELGLRKIEHESGGNTSINRKFIEQGSVVDDPETGRPVVSFKTTDGSGVHFHINEDGTTATCYATRDGERIEISDEIPTEDIIDVANEFGKEDSPKKSLTSSAVTAIVMGRQIKKEWRRMKKRNKNNEIGLPRMPFSSIFYNFINKGLAPLGGSGNK